MLLVNLVLGCRIQYGKSTEVTKLTFAPYLYSGFFLLAQFFESLSLLIVNLEEQNEKPGRPWKIDELLEKHLFS